MKKEILIVCAVIVVFVLFASNSSNGNSSDSYAEGQQDAVEQIKDAAHYDHKTYVDVEVLEDIIRMEFGDYSDEVRDALIYHPDNQLYDASDIVNDTIDNYCSFDY